MVYDLDGGDFECVTINGSQANPCLYADILGDWREEVLWRTRDGQSLRLFTTTIPSDMRLPTLMHDPVYRLSAAWQNVAYNQPTQPGFYLGRGMTAPPRPAIRTVAFIPDGQEAQNEWHFDFGPGPVEPGYTLVLPDMAYREELGFGFLGKDLVDTLDQRSHNALQTDFVTSAAPFFFTVDVPEGNYRVTVTLGDANTASNTTVKAELCRLMLENISTEPGQFVQHKFVVNVRRPPIAGGGAVHLKDREKTQEARAWDGN